MKLAIFGGVVAICAATAIAAAQQAAPADTQTILGCLKGEGTAQSPWMLTGVADCTVPTRVWGRSRLTRAPWSVPRGQVNPSQPGPARRQDRVVEW